MKRILASTALVLLSESAATAGSPVRYNEPPTSSQLPSYPVGEQSREAGRNDDVTGSIRGRSYRGRTYAPIVSKDGFAPARPVAPPPSWTGFYVGATLGTGWAKFRLSDKWSNFDGVGMFGASVGATAGFDYQFSPSIVAGIAVDGNVNTTAAKDSSSSGESTFREAASWALRGRLGTLTSDDTLVYVTAGVSEVFTRESDSGSSGGSNARFVGGVFGAGVETRLTGNLYGRVEYLHGVYGKRSFDGGASYVHPDTGVARIGLIFRPSESDGRDAPFAPTGARGPLLRESWTGAHIGAHGGVAWASTKFSDSNSSTDGVGGAGGVGGVLLGYDYQYGRSVFGLEVDGSAGGARSTSSQVFPPTSAQTAYEWDYSIRARAGHLFGDTLLFGTAGWSQTYGRLTTVGLFGTSASHAFTGFQLGGGMETMLTEHVGARLEYLHSFYEKYAAVLGSSTDARPTTGKTRAAVIYKF
ncbi:outer membrane protein [Methylosinus sp. PW1]|uniref:outer membrane protein n=1 Tax=Methylosinus sp. PW1 TaxID=107636 RepID=UPI00055D54B4|nr:outer membrane beta-barrel protein [Methylosinus sp. PW1]